MGIPRTATSGLLLADIGISAGVALIDGGIVWLAHNGPPIAGVVAGSAFCVATLALLLVQGADGTRES